MSFTLVDAAGALDECVEVLRRTEPTVSSTIEMAKTMYTDGNCAEALDIAIDALGTCSCDASTLLTKLDRARSHIVRGDEELTSTNALAVTKKELDAIRSEVAQVKHDVKAIIKERDEAQSRKARLRRKILLGQLAYSMGLVIRKHVMLDQGPPVNLSQMLAGNLLLNQAQQDRWDLLRSKLQQWCDLNQLQLVDEYLRNLRFETAHGTTAELRSTSAADLEAWAASECSVDWTQFVKEYVRIVAKFAEPDRPLRISMAALESTLDM